jgi:SNF2 family DNA or RNA helicase
LSYTLVDDRLEERLLETPQARGEWLFLEPHPEFGGQWRVECWEPNFYFDFRELIGSYKAVTPAKLDKFLALAEELEYKVAFFQDPAFILDDYANLNRTPEVSIASNFEGTVNGLLPFQVQGYNMLKDLTAGVFRWDTGTGKTVLAAALLKYHEAMESYDTAFMVTKKPNKVNTQRKLLKLAGLDARIPPALAKKELVSGTYYPRREFFEGIDTGQSEIVITHYETFREDKEWIMPLFAGRKVMVIWDEMPTKLSSRASQLYKAVKWCMYEGKDLAVSEAAQRSEWLAQYMLSATPIESTPEGFFNCVRLMDPTIYGTVSSFETEYVARWARYGKPRWPDDKGEPAAWHKLDKMGLKAAHMTHDVDKSDPTIAKQFPKAIEEIFYCEWSDADRKIYNEISVRGDEQDVNPIALISLLQMVCDEPSMLENSAAIYEEFEEAYAIWEEDGLGKRPNKKGSATAVELIDGLDFSGAEHGKQEALRYLLEKHRGEKTLIFSALNESLMPTLEARLQEWGIRYVRYNGTEKQKQDAEDAFMEDPSIEVFLTSDMGSDSLDLYVGDNVINYNLPWKWSTKVQRQNRIHRASSEKAYNRVYTLAYPGSVEDRKDEVIAQKKGYHDAVFKGTIHDRAISARMTREDLYYILGR